MSSPSAERLQAWRLFFESSLALTDLLDAELEDEEGIPMRWYDVLVHLEESPDGIQMNALAERILYSKSGLTRVVDRMEEAGLVRRERPPDDRRVVLVHMTPEGDAALQASRAVHRDGIRRHFTEHLGAEDLARLQGMLEKVRDHVRPLRPGRVSR